MPLKEGLTVLEKVVSACRADSGIPFPLANIPTSPFSPAAAFSGGACDGMVVDELCGTLTSGASCFHNCLGIRGRF
ncbi:hypothetical protein [Variovorax sp. YR566]|uniref:hypothetical protein n=1 Tax=Variovorax sp. YR566 TaxID=3450237 RepID=UPI003F7F0132